MKKMEKNDNEYYVVDVLHILKSLWKRAWAILLISVGAGVLALAISLFCVTPKYSSSVMLYVNNSSSTVNNTGGTISSSDITAAQSLVKTYIVILNNRTTLEEVIDHTGVAHTYEELSDMISAAAVDETEVFRVTVTTEDPHEAELIANGIADILPGRVADIIDGSSMRLVDGVDVNTEKVSPNVTQNTVIGLLIGFFGACLLFAVIALLDDTIRGEDFVAQNYDVPILARIPDLAETEQSREYTYYKGYHSAAKDAETR